MPDPSHSRNTATTPSVGRLIVALVLAAGLVAFAWLAWPLSMVLVFALALAFN